MPSPVYLNSIKDAADWIDADLGKKISICTPLGLGKPNLLLNEIYSRVKQDPERKLTQFTALSLQIPEAKSDLEKRFLGPFKDRHFGKDYPELQYAVDASHNRVPKNVTLHEFYFLAGKELYKPHLQMNYISLNYTHVVQSVYEQGVEALLCIIAKHPVTGKTYSLSSNPDLTLDVADLYRKNGKRMKMIGVVHPQLPFMTEDAEVNPEFFDVIVETPEMTADLFALPRDPIAEDDFMIGLQASLLVADGGTIQVGIGSLSDALIYCLRMRHLQNAKYVEITNRLIKERFSHHDQNEFHQGRFVQGLYGTSEMVMDAFMNLQEAGILKRMIMDSDDQILRYLHGAFFLGSKKFYQWMKDRFYENDRGVCMTRVSKVNDLYDPHELAIRRQRKKARFFNMAMNATLLGGVASDSLGNGQVVSGVGGQFNFVSMSHELPDSHSVILLRSTKKMGKHRHSNIVWSHEQLTIPRHLRDVVITEHGIAFTRGQRDEDVIRSMVSIADSSFQPELIRTSVRNGKLSADFKLPISSAKNDAASVNKFLKPYLKEGLFPAFPFGSDFTPVEEILVSALSTLQAKQAYPLKILSTWFKGLFVSPVNHLGELERMDLKTPHTLSQWFYQKLLLAELAEHALPEKK
jgi:acyl-CoA hydrolase